MTNVAIFPCGSEAGLEVFNALRHEKNIHIFGASSTRCHGEATYANYDCSLPYISSRDFKKALIDYVTSNKIDILFPAYDDVILKLAEFRDEIPCHVVVPDTDVCNIARFKSKTYAALKGLPVCPWSTLDPEEIRGFPVFAKPDQGQGSQGISLIEDEVELRNQIRPGLIYCENLPGEEYTVDCFTDRKGDLKVCLPRIRQRVKGGISVRSSSVHDNGDFRKIGDAILSRIALRGVWFFQVKKDSAGEYKLLEVAPRVSGSMATTRAQGQNLALMSVYDVLGYDIDTLPSLPDVTIERSLSCKYLREREFETAYVDFDDTITFNGGINLTMIQFLYHCLNRKKKIILITRHASDIMISLSKYRLAPEIFDDIIHIQDARKKSAFILPENAIFIDDSFAERKDVSKVLGIPVFSVDMVESLIDWRIP